MNDRNLYQRLAAVASEVGIIKPTGKTAQGTKTLSVVDVENALRGLFVKHHVLTGYRWNAAPTLVEIATAPKANKETGEVYAPAGTMYLWQADLTVWALNPDAPDEKIEDRTCDIGSSPSAAVSFALKRWYRAMFHLADEGDDVRPVGEASTVARRAATTRPVPPSERTSVALPQPNGTSLSRLQGAMERQQLTEAKVLLRARKKFGEAIKQIPDLTDGQIDELLAEVALGT